LVSSMTISGYLYLSELHKPLFVTPLSSVLSENNTNSSDDQTHISVVEAKLKEKNIDFSEIKPVNGGYRILMKNGGEVLFSSHKDIALQISSLQFILSRLTMESKLFSRLDLRFDKPVVVLQ